MFLTYTPGDGEAQRWEFNPAKVRSDEAEAIERCTGWDWGEFSMHVLNDSVLARRALLWTFLRRVHKVLRFEDVHFALDEVELEFDAAELGGIRESVAAQRFDTEAERDAALAHLDKLIANAPQPPGKAGASDGG